MCFYTRILKKWQNKNWPNKISLGRPTLITWLQSKYSKTCLGIYLTIFQIFAAIEHTVYEYIHFYICIYKLNTNQRFSLWATLATTYTLYLFICVSEHPYSFISAHLISRNSRTKPSYYVFLGVLICLSIFRSLDFGCACYKLD